MGSSRSIGPRRALRCIMLFQMILGLLSGCAGLDQAGLKETEVIRAPASPEILATYAPLEVDPLGVLKVYVKASDEEGDIRYVYFWIDAPFGGSPIRMRVDPDQGKALSGFYSMDLWDLKEMSSIGVLRFRVFLEDRGGRQSEQVAFSLRFRLAAPMDSPPEGVFQEKLLGRVPAPFAPQLAPGAGGM